MYQWQSRYRFFFFILNECGFSIQIYFLWLLEHCTWLMCFEIYLHVYFFKGLSKIGSCFYNRQLALKWSRNMKNSDCRLSTRSHYGMNVNLTSQEKNNHPVAENINNSKWNVFSKKKKIFWIISKWTYPVCSLPQIPNVLSIMFLYRDFFFSKYHT
jgi:hypothetical protein